VTFSKFFIGILGRVGIWFGEEACDRLADSLEGKEERGEQGLRLLPIAGSCFDANKKSD